MHGEILIIGDGSPGTEELYDALREEYGSRGLFTGPLTSELDVSYASLRGFDYVVLCPGNRYPDISTSLQSHIREYVAGGGFLVCLPFTTYAAHIHGNRIIEELLPVTCKGYFEESTTSILHNSIRRPKGTPKNVNPNSPKCYLEPQDRDVTGVAGEFLSPKADVDVLGTIGVGKRQTPLAVHWRVGEGDVFYFNLSYHPCRERPGFFLDEAQESTLAFRLLDSWTSLCSWARPKAEPSDTRRRRIRLPRFVTGLAAMFEDATPVKPYVENDKWGLFDYVNSRYIHYGEGRSPHSLLMPSLDEYESLPLALRVSVVRCLLTATRLLWVPDHASVTPRDLLSDDWREIFEPSNDKKKRYFESLLLYFLLLPEPLSFENRNLRTSTGEIDILLRNDARSGFWGSHGDLIPVECKNWKQSIGAKEMRDFLWKIKSIRATTGIIASYNGFTGKPQADALGVAREAFSDGIRVVPLDMTDLRQGLRFIDPSRIIEEAATRIRTA